MAGESITVEIVGLPELMKQLERLRMPPEDVEAILWKHAKNLQGNIRAVTPIGKTGNLLKAVVAKKMKGDAYFRLAFVATDYWRAPHDHLIEFGHRIVTHKGVDTGWRANGNAFFWPTVRRDLPGIGEDIVKELGGLILERVK